MFLDSNYLFSKCLLNRNLVLSAVFRSSMLVSSSIMSANSQQNRGETNVKSLQLGRNRHTDLV
jgi:hypothetical protein